MSKIEYSPESIDDLRKIRDYIAEEFCDKQTADRSVDRILKKISILDTFPEIGAPLSSIVPFETNYRFLVCGNYTTFYQTDGKGVYIVRILYGRRNFMQILFGEPSEPAE